MKHPSSISVIDFTYHLPQEKIAAYPLAERDESKLLVYKHDVIREDRFKNLDQFLGKDAVLVFNSTKVVSARLLFETITRKPIEIFCLEPFQPNLDLSAAMASCKAVKWKCLVGNLRNWKQDNILLERHGIALTAKIDSRGPGTQVIDFSWKPDHFCFAEVLEAVGNIPIPPYLKRNSEDVDQVRYQTIYAENEGSVAAPTAGLHFTDRVFKNLEKKEIRSMQVTLHVGAGTFMPVKSDTMRGHQMHAEWIDVNRTTIKNLLDTPADNIIAVGTTSLRTIESIYWMGLKAYYNPNAGLADLEVLQWDPYELKEVSKSQSLNALLEWMDGNQLSNIICKTSILIAPPYQLKLSGGIITNFHQPQSTLLLLISAIVGEKWKDIYTYALLNNFRFLSYGDSSLLLK